MIVGKSKGMEEVRRVVASVASTELSVLITGEVGTGKGLVARLIHQNGSRREKPYVVINLAAMPSELVAAELVGFVEGAFTGASSN